MFQPVYDEYVWEKKLRFIPYFFWEHLINIKIKNTSVRKKAKAPNNQMYKSYYVEDPKL